MKKLLIILLISLLAISMVFVGTGCKEEAVKETEEVKEAEEVKEVEEEVAEEEVIPAEEEITLSMFTQEPGALPEILPRIIERFESKYPNVKIEKKVVGYGEYQSTLALMIASEDAPDIMLVETGAPYNAKVEAGALVNLDEYLEADDGAWAKTMDEAVREVVKFNGSQYCVVLYPANIHFFINGGLLEEMGLSEPKTTQDLIAMAEELSGTGVAPISMGLADKWGAVDLFVALAWQQGGGDILHKADAGEASWMDPIFVNIMDTIKQMVDAGVFYEGATAMTYHEDVLPIFAQGISICMYPAGNFMLESVPPEIDVIPVNFPTMPGGESVLTGGAAGTWAVSSQSEHIDLAVEFLKEFTTQEAYEDVVTAGLTPAGPVENKDIKAPSAVYDEINKVASTAVDRRIYTPELYDAIAVAVQGVWSGDISPEAAMEQVQKISDEVYGK